MGCFLKYCYFPFFGFSANLKKENGPVTVPDGIPGHFRRQTTGKRKEVEYG
jgi:hypothetical protein